MKKIIINKYFIGITVLLILSFLFFMNRLVNRYAQGNGKKKSSEQIELQKEVYVPPEMTKYDIAVSKSKNVLQSQLQWDYQTKEVVKRTDLLEQMESNEAFKGGEKTPQKFDQRLERINQRINTYKELISQDPANPELQRHLNDLYQMRAMVTNLEDVVVEK